MNKNENKYKTAIEPILPMGSTDENNNSDSPFSTKQDELLQSYKDLQLDSNNTEKVSATQLITETDKGFSLDDSF